MPSESVNPRKSQTSSDESLYAWNRFTASCHAYQIPPDDCLYALPCELIDRILEDVPGFWTPEEKQFEETLSTTSGGVFLNKRPQDYRAVATFLLTTDFGPRGLSPREKQLGRGDKWKNSNDLVRQSATRKAETDNIDAKEKHSGESTKILRIAYSGWLITNSTFLSELDSIRRDAPSSVGRNGRFPILRGGFSEASHERASKTFMGVWGPKNEEERRFNELCQTFLGRWCLQALFSWDIPVPMIVPEFDTTLPLVAAENAGVHIFLPWYLMRKKELRVDELLKTSTASLAGTHLTSWLEGGGGKQKGRKNRADGDLGPIRFARLFRLFVYLNLAIGRRYGTKLEKSPGILDSVFMTYFGLGERRRRRDEDPDPRSIQDIRRVVSKFWTADGKRIDNH
jgi:hypothetical protein